MKKRILCLIIFIMLIMLICFGFSHAKTYEGHNGLIEKAREEIPLSNIASIEISIGGSVDVNGYSLVWFVTGNEEQGHDYFPMEFKVSEKDVSKYRFVKAYKAYERGQDIVSLPWNGYIFLVNNPNCEKIILDYGNGRVEEIEVKGEYLPEIYSTPETDFQYIFVDDEGNEIR